MPSNKHQCCKEVLGATSCKHKCSKARSYIVKGSFVSSELNACDEYKICQSLHTKLSKEHAGKESNPTNRVIIADDNEMKAFCNESNKRQRRSFDDILKTEIATHNNQFKTKIRDLSQRSRLRRVTLISHIILAAVIDAQRFQDEGMEHVNEMKAEISTDIEYVTSNVEMCTSKWIKMDVRKFKNENTPLAHDMQLAEDTEVIAESKVKNEFFDHVNDEKKNVLVKTLLLETTQKAYGVLRDSICHLCSMSIESLPSYYMATKHRVPLESGEIDLLPEYLPLLPSKDRDAIKKSNDAQDFLGKKNKIKAKYYSKIVGGYEKFFNLLFSKLEHCVKSSSLKKIVIFDSFDGANHLETTEGKVDLISFSSTCANKYLLSLNDYSAAKSSATLTWQQVAAKEELCAVLSSMQSHYK